MSKYLRRGLLSFFLCVILISGSTMTAYAAAPAFNVILLSRYTATLDIGDEFYLVALSFSGRRPTFRSSNSSVASVNPYGRVTAKKAGRTVITVRASGATSYCSVTVKKTQITINHTSFRLERGEKVKLNATTSNGSKIKWKINKKSIASISENGTVTALKPGEAIVTATADKSSVTCHIIVRKPTIKLNMTQVTINPGQSIKLSATVSSGISPNWKSSRKSIAIVDDTGVVCGIKSGTTVISAKLDGAEKTCIVTVR